MKANVGQAQIKNATDTAIKMIMAFAVMTLRNDEKWGQQRLQRFLKNMQDTAEYYHTHYQDNGGQYRGKCCQTNDTIFLALDRDLKAAGINLHFMGD